MLGNFNPSNILNEIYDILEEYEISPDIYYSSVVEKNHRLSKRQNSRRICIRMR